jgi:hypothetical protein
MTEQTKAATNSELATAQNKTEFDADFIRFNNAKWFCTGVLLSSLLATLLQNAGGCQ